LAARSPREENPLPTESCTHCLGSHTGERPCFASATVKARAWLLIEHPGPWADRLDDTTLAAPVSRALARAREQDVRVQLIRRPGRRRPTPPIQVYAAWSGPGAWLEGKELDDPAELNNLDLRAVGAGTRPGFGVPAENLFLVCANGKHNPCCARLGAPLARALHDGLGDLVWETTHLGGDRFAANLVCLPHGLYYGDLALVDGFVAAERYLRGEVWLKHYRGRAGLPQPAQAAEHFLRDRTGIPAVDDFTIESVSEAPISEVVVGLGAERYRVIVARVPLDPCQPGCEAEESTYLLKDVTQLLPLRPLKAQQASQTDRGACLLAPTRLQARQAPRLVWPRKRRICREELIPWNTVSSAAAACACQP
jgi:Sucrase/ferredoxin-like